MGTKARFIPLLFLLFVTLWLRLVNLGYSDYQGDELKALASPAAGQSLFDFLLEQKKGPTQFIASALIRLAHPTLENQFVTRLPFALAGIAAVYIFYRLVARHFGQRIAVMATLLLSINGLLVGLARIVQYQSFVILFSLLALYCFSLALQEQRWKILGIYAGMLCWAGAVLSHFDGIFIAPFALYLLACWYRAYPGLPAGRRLKHLLLPAALAALLLAAFYVPYLTSLRASTQQYWWLRISGEESEAGLPSSLFTFTLYNPLLAIYLYIGLGLMSLFRLRQVYPILLWFAFPWLVLERIVADPGTHIYTYLIPATILVAVGVDVCAELLGRLVGERLSRVSVYAGFGLAVLFLSAVSHLIFIDHTPEYPWKRAASFPGPSASRTCSTACGCSASHTTGAGKRSAPPWLNCRAPGTIRPMRASRLRVTSSPTSLTSTARAITSTSITRRAFATGWQTTRSATGPRNIRR